MSLEVSLLMFLTMIYMLIMFTSVSVLILLYSGAVMVLMSVILVGALTLIWSILMVECIYTVPVYNGVNH